MQNAFLSVNILDGMLTKQVFLFDFWFRP